LPPEIHTDAKRRKKKKRRENKRRAGRKQEIQEEVQGDLRD
jgi:hypothetical protein